MKEKLDEHRRSFLKQLGQGGIFLGLLGLGGTMIARQGTSREQFWQIDPHRCIQCGRCQSNCVLKPSAVKTIHAYAMCGYCDLCSGYLRKGASRSTAAEDQLCPSGAIQRSFVEDPYFQYVIDEALCIACGKCVHGCGAFGNGSLFLQIKQELCVHCNQCNIASNCPAQAISQIDAHQPYRLKGVQG